PACREDAEPLHSAEVVLRARSPGREAEMKGDESYRDSQSHAGSLWQRCQRRDDRERGAERRYPHVGRIHVRRQEERVEKPGNEGDEPARRRTEPRSCGLREPRGSYGDAREGEGHYAHADVPGWRPARGIQRSYGGRDVATEGLQGGERCERHPVSHGAAVRRPHRIPEREEHKQEQQLRGDVAPSHDPEWGDLPRESAPIASALPQHRHRAHDGGGAHRGVTAEQSAAISRASRRQSRRPCPSTATALTTAGKLTACSLQSRLTAKAARVAGMGHRGPGRRQIHRGGEYASAVPVSGKSANHLPARACPAALAYTTAVAKPAGWECRSRLAIA